MSEINTESTDYLAGRIAALEEIEADYKNRKHEMATDYDAAVDKLKKQADEVMLQCATCYVWQSGYNDGYKDADRHNNPGNYDDDGNFIGRR